VPVTVPLMPAPFNSASILETSSTPLRTTESESKASVLFVSGLVDGVEPFRAGFEVDSVFAVGQADDRVVRASVWRRIRASSGSSPPSNSNAQTFTPVIGALPLRPSRPITANQENSAA
jgi:hypothetical protein